MKHFCLITACLFVLSCSGSDAGETFIRFSFEDQDYDIKHATFSVANVNRPGWKFAEIAKDITRSDAYKPPTASLQWRMPFTDVESLNGQTIELKELNDSEMADPLVNFVLSDSVSVANFSKTDVIVTITSVTEHVIEGSFRGNDLTYMDDGQGTAVDVTGTFRVRIVR